MVVSKMLRIRIECRYHFNNINIIYVGDTTAFLSILRCLRVEFD